MRFAASACSRKTATSPAQRLRTSRPCAYGLLIEIELVWQSLGAEAGSTLYSISLGPGEEVKVAVSDGRWRKSPDARERPLQIVAKMIGARQIGDGMGCDAARRLRRSRPDERRCRHRQAPRERTVRTCEALRRRALGRHRVRRPESLRGHRSGRCATCGPRECSPIISSSRSNATA